MFGGHPRTKGALARRRRELALYEQVLPSLELKRQQLLAERARERRHLASMRAALAADLGAAGARLPMLANVEVPLDGLVRVAAIEQSETRVLGTPVPRLAEIRWAGAEYGLLAKPHWVEAALAETRGIVHRRLEIAFAAERLRRLDRAIAKVLQRVNLFRKILIPAARLDIRRIRTSLADAERAAVVRSKIFKARHQRAAAQR